LRKQEIHIEDMCLFVVSLYMEDYRIFGWFPQKSSIYKEMEGINMYVYILQFKLLGIVCPATLSNIYFILFLAVAIEDCSTRL